MGIYYYRARWYDPAVGRFISQDPIRFRAGDPNLYRYVGNAPGDATDPSGLILFGFIPTTGDEWSAFLKGSQDGALMVYNAATFHQDTQVNDYVNNVIQQNGGVYSAANISSHAGVYLFESAVILWALPFGVSGATTLANSLYNPKVKDMIFGGLVMVNLWCNINMPGNLGYLNRLLPTIINFKPWPFFLPKR